MATTTLFTEYGLKMHAERIPGITYTLSYGGGVNSTALAIEIVQRGLPLDYVVFADPGFERPETYDFVNDYMAPYFAQHGVPFCMVVKRRPAGQRETIVDYWMHDYRVPDRIYRDCTRRHKVEPIHKFYKHQAGATEVCEYIGISSDESRRVKKSPSEWIHKCYPLVELRIDRVRCKEIIKGAGMPVPSKSGCPNCFAAKKPELYNLWKTNPKMFETAIQIEDNYLKNKEGRGLTPYYYLMVKNKPTPLRALKAEFESVTTLDPYTADPADKPDPDADCVESCMT